MWCVWYRLSYTLDRIHIGHLICTRLCVCLCTPLNTGLFFFCCEHMIYIYIYIYIYHCYAHIVNSCDWKWKWNQNRNAVITVCRLDNAISAMVNTICTILCIRIKCLINLMKTQKQMELIYQCVACQSETIVSLSRHLTSFSVKIV